jgi:hypothetical protein
MSRLAVPLLDRKLWATGDVLVRGELPLLLKDKNGVWKRRTFLADSGTEMTTMPAALAKQINLPLPPQAVSGAIHFQTGLAIRSGYLRVQVVGMDGTEYVFPCFFLGDPDVPLLSIPGRPVPRKLLGLTGVVDKLRLCFDGTPGPGAPYGYLVVEKQ